MRERAISVWAVSLILLASAFIPEAARAQNNPPAEAVAIPIGKVVSASGAVKIDHVAPVVVQANVAGSAGQTKVGDLVYKGDVVSTGADGALGIAFSDGSAFNLSSNARMVLNEFVYDPNGKSNSTLFSLSKGTFTFVAGKIAKTGDMKVDTPVATMGIRGTTPRVEISDDGKVTFNTLVEDKKAIEKTLAGASGGSGKKQRQTKVVAPPGTTEPTMKLDSTYDINIKICQGC